MLKRTLSEEERTRRLFDSEIINHYINDIQTQLGMTNDRLWEHIAELLVTSGTTKWRRILKAGRHGTGGQGKPEPRLADLLRYLAATGRQIALPSGRDVVLRSLATTLVYIRSQLPGYTRETISAREVEQLRYVLEHPAYLDPAEGVSWRMIEKMRCDISHTFNDRSAHPDIILQEVRRLVRSWRPSWALLIQALPYRWIYYK